MAEQTDRRRHSRFKARVGLAAVIKHGTGSKIGIITDMSMGGFAFSYCAREKHVQVPKGPLKLSAIFSADEIIPFELPCNTIVDQSTISEHTNGLVPLMKCGVAFGKVASGQRAQLESFITKYTGDPVC